MKHSFLRAQHAQRRSPARTPLRLIATLSVGIIALATATSSAGSALLTTETVKTDNSANTRPYVQEWGAFNASARPHLGTTFSDGTQGFLQLSLFDGPTAPSPVPTVASGEQIVVKAELPTGMHLDRAAHLRGPAHNWCAGLPTPLSEIFGVPVCEEVTHAGGGASISMTLTPDRDLDAAVFEAMNDLTVGFGLRSTATVDATNTVHVNVLFPHASGRPRIGQADYRTAAEPGSSLGVWNLQLVNESWDDAPTPQHWRGKDDGVARFELTADAAPVRMRTGETFRFQLELFQDDEAHFEVAPADEWCDALVPAGFTADCAVDSAAPGLVSVGIERTGPDTDDAFPGGLTAVIPVIAVSDVTTEGESRATIWSDMLQGGSAQTVTTTHVYLEPGFGVPETGPVEDLRADNGSSVVFAPDGKTAYASVIYSGFSYIRIIDVATNKQSGTISGISATASPDLLAVTPDGRWMYVGYNNGGIGVVDLDLGSQIGVVEGYTGGRNTKNALTLDPSGALLYAQTANSTTVQVIDTGTHTQVGELDAETEIYSFALSPDGTRAYASSNRGLAIIDVASATVIDRIVFTPSVRTFSTLTVTKDGSRLYASGAFDTLIIDTQSLEWRVMETHGRQAPSVFALSPDESFALISFTHDDPNNLYIFDTTAGKTIGTVEGYSGQHSGSIQFAPDGSKAYVMSVFGTPMSVLTPRGTISSAVS